ncbi:MAG: uracil-DNA glycosylase [Treponema sp.]|nr:uracil-DNA glycosylase [Treponema sp.]
MRPEQKQKLAGFLDLAGDYLRDGYVRPREPCSFTDDPGSGQGSDRGSGAAAPLSGGPSFSRPREGADTGADTLEGIAAEIGVCRSCPLGAGRTNAVPGEGAEHPLVLVVGEGPGQDEDRTGRPFVGPAGQLLDKMLASIGLGRETNCFIVNVVKCRPPGNRDPEAEELLACAPYLERQIRCLKPRALLCVGRISANSLLGNVERQSIRNLRGRFVDYFVQGMGAVPLIATYHPSALLRNEEWKRPAWEDLKMLRAKIDEIKGT